jgi:hypothetical protein
MLTQMKPNVEVVHLRHRRDLTYGAHREVAVHWQVWDELSQRTANSVGNDRPNFGYSESPPQLESPTSYELSLFWPYGFSHFLLNPS